MGNVHRQIMVPGQLGTLIQKMSKAKSAGSMAPKVEHLHCKHKASIETPVLPKEKKNIFFHLLNVFPQKIKHNVLLLIHYYPSQ
jgi:hypothetical protein